MVAAIAAGAGVWQAARILVGPAVDVVRRGDLVQMMVASGHVETSYRVEIGSQILVMTSLGHPLGFVALSVPVLLSILAIAALYLALAEVVKPLAMRGRCGRKGRRADLSDARRVRPF